MLIIYQKKDSLIAVEWHFFATSNGKGLCDDVDGTINDRQPQHIFKILTINNK
jgi:hypothetical protein